MKKKLINEKLKEYKQMLESEKTNLTDKIFNLEKEKMQWNLEKQIMNNNKMELEEK